MTGRRSHGRLSALNGVVHQGKLLSLRGAAGVIEFFGGALIPLGLFVPHVAFVASG